MTRYTRSDEEREHDRNVFEKAVDRFHQKLVKAYDEAQQRKAEKEAEKQEKKTDE